MTFDARRSLYGLSTVPEEMIGCWGTDLHPLLRRNGRYACNMCSEKLVGTDQTLNSDKRTDTPCAIRRDFSAARRMSLYRSDDDHWIMGTVPSRRLPLSNQGWCVAPNR